MEHKALVKKAYKISESSGAILHGSIIIKGDIQCIMFGYYCKSTLFYKDFFNVAKDTLSVNRIANKNLKKIKKMIQKHGYRKVWAKGVLSFYGDLRPLAVKAGFGQWGKNGLVVNEKYGSDFLITAIFFQKSYRIRRY